ncbi:hypothetical protein Sta7437_3693 [Stanieria cyanosphaera PCC 7437]|uniref:Low-complexity tail membrane protein n=1 Tax=Stanieria cyanosphaera (strain ATCC 29371 / PCC 7437) TaxID=111780 RepID=K9XYT4_STAC7|nr:low-complexity tail membrane protein [Stanieria cyanosphaera]AFZ37189.1 hypothetical protein Sta7437_3693 [Stanieria cyanosphaera PCC 7437]
MSSFRSEPFLWIHLTGIVLVPLWLEIVWLGLSIGTPLLWFWLELLLLAVVGILPILWMQLVRPFDIFSILLFSVKPEQLSSEQRQILAQFKTRSHRIVSIITAIMMILILWFLDSFAPLLIPINPWSQGWHLIGLIIAAVSLLASNLFLQVPVSVLRILLSNQASLAATEPLPSDQIAREFTIPGFWIDSILAKEQLG